MKFLDILKTANQNLLRNKVRTILTILAIFIGSFTIILNTAMSTAVNTFIDQQTANYGGEGILNITTKNISNSVSALSGGNVQEYNESTDGSNLQYIKPADIEKITAIDGIKNVTPTSISSVEYITSKDTNKKFKITATPMNSDSIKLDLVTGQTITTDDKNYDIVLPPDYAQALGFDSDENAIGKTVTLAIQQPTKCYTVATTAECTATVDATVVGVQAPGVISTGTARISNALNDKLSAEYQVGMPASSRNNYLMVTADAEPDHIDEIKTELDKLGYTATTVRDTAGAVKSFFDIIITVFTLFGCIALLAAAIGIINTLLMSVQERTREIGLSKALGMSSGKIFLSFSLEAISLGFWGSLIGVLVAIGLGNLLNVILHLPGSLLTSFPTFNIVEFTLPNIIIIMLIIMLIAFLAGTAPAIKAARKDPIESLRYE